MSTFAGYEQRDDKEMCVAVFTIAAKTKNSDAVILQLRNLSDGRLDFEPISEDFMDWDL